MLPQIFSVGGAMFVQVINEIADNYGYGVVKEYVGHGVGRSFHSAPTIQHCRNNDSGVMQLWQTFTIEPMLTQVHVSVSVLESAGALTGGTWWTLPWLPPQS